VATHSHPKNSLALPDSVVTTLKEAQLASEEGIKKVIEAARTLQIALQTKHTDGNNTISTTLAVP